MAVIRPALPSLAWTPVPNAWIRDPDLPQGPKSLLIYYLSHTEGYRCSVAQAAREQGVGRDTVAAQNKKLVQLGYLVSVEQQRGDRGRFAENDYQITDCTDRRPPRPQVSENPTLPGMEPPSATVPVITGSVEPGTVDPPLRRTLGEDHSETPTEFRPPLRAVPHPDSDDGQTVNQRANTLAREHFDAAGGLGGSRAFMGLRGIVADALNAGHPDGQVRAALAHLRSRGRAVTRAALGPLLSGADTAGAVSSRRYGPHQPYRDPDPSTPNAFPERF